MSAAGQTVAALFAVPHSKKRKRYLEALEAGMDASSADKASSFSCYCICLV